MKKFVALLSLIVLFTNCNSTQKTASENKNNSVTDTLSVKSRKPKLVVGVVVDQMRYDYLTRFWNDFEEDGFKRLINEGFTCRNTHYNYVPTYTGPGHTSIYTGTTPSVHGIISNNWYDKFMGEEVYCAGDKNVNPVGTTSSAGKMSPHRMKVTTVSDQNRLHTQFRGKTIGIAIKDRGAILPAGHTANAAYWFYGKEEGKFITSSFYRENLPQWVIDFNNSKKAESYLKPWNTLKPIDDYTESGSDLNNFEFGFSGKENATFPYDLKELSEQNGGYDILKSTPFGNNLTTDFAIAALNEEKLGEDNDTDFLTISYSSPDYIGHNFGVNSKEIQDNYIRLDQDIARLLNELDEKVGKGNYTLFLTADHGAINVPAYLKSKKIPSGYIDVAEMKKELTSFLGEEYGVTDLIENISNNQLFFNYNRVNEENISRKQLETDLKEFLLKFPHINKVVTRSALEENDFTEGAFSLVQNGFDQKRSGDVVIIFDPAFIIYPEKGSTHGSTLNYDTHAPLIFYGNGINNGETYEKTLITDIAPTISALLGIAFPNGATGNVLPFVLKKD